MIFKIIFLVGLICSSGFFCLIERAEGLESLTNLIEGAKKEGNLTLYHSTTNEDTKSFVDSFTGKYPFIKVNTYRAGQVALISRVMTEWKAQTNKWDVIFLNSLLLNELKKQGILQKYEAQESAAYGKGFRDDQGFWYAFLLNAQVVGYNTRIVKPADIPKTFLDLTESKWKGKIAIDAEPYEWLMCLEKEWGKEKTWSYIKKLGQQRMKVLRGRSLLVQLLAAGEFSLSLPLYSYRIEQMKKVGAPLEWVAMDPVSVNMVGMALSEKPQNPNVAKLFLEFTLSREGQQTVRQLGRIPARLEVKPNPARLTEGIKLVPSDPGQSDETKRVLEEFKAMVR